MKRILYLIAIAISVFSFNACERTELSETVNSVQTIEQSDLNVAQFCPSHNVKVENGMMIFDSKIAYDVTLIEILHSNPELVEEWYKSIGVETFYQVFNQVVKAENAIDSHLRSLSESEQEYWKKQPEYHSAAYDEAIVNGILIASQKEGNSTYDYNLADKTVAPLINTIRLVQIEDKIYQYNDNSIVIVDKEDIDLLKSKNLETNEKTIVITYDDCNLKSVNSSYNWTQIVDFKYTTSNRHRARFWIDGHSELVIHKFDDGSWSNDHCSDYIDCTFYLRIECQKKNFWGNWVWETDVPSTTINASWNYNYGSYDSDPYITYGCGLYDRDINYVPSYNCSPNPSSICPTSPINNLVLVGNGYYYPVTPHGRWHTATAYFFSHPFEVHGNATATIEGCSYIFNYSW